jgi:hypothetical protein
MTTASNIVAAALVAFGTSVLLDAGDAQTGSGLGDHPLQCVPADQCCKICRKGQACGNTCISRSKNCHKGRGCACDAGEVCGAGEETAGTAH